MPTPPRRSALASFAALAALVLIGPPAWAAERSGPRAFVGYSFAHLDDTNRHGLDAGADFAFAGPFSLFLDVSRHWGSGLGTSLTDLTAMAGPGGRLGWGGGRQVFLRALVGLVRSRESIGVLDVGISETDDRLGVLLGGGVEIPVGSRLGVRAEGDYLWSDVEEEGQAGGFRASLGLVYRFGGRP